MKNFRENIQLPETWEEFLNFVKQDHNVTMNSNKDWIELSYNNIYTIDGPISESIIFYRDGLVKFDKNISIKRSINQMYLIYLGFKK